MSQFVALAIVVTCLLVLLGLYVASVTVFSSTIPPEAEEEQALEAHHSH